MHGARSNRSVGMEQQVTGVDPKNVRVKRQLNSKVAMTEKIVGDSEERLPTAEESEVSAEAAKYFLDNLAGPDKLPIPEFMLHYDSFWIWASIVEKAFPEDDLKAEEATIKQLLEHYDTAAIIRIIWNGERFQKTSRAAGNLELALMLRLMAEGEEQTVVSHCVMSAKLHTAFSIVVVALLIYYPPVLFYSH